MNTNTQKIFKLLPLLTFVSGLLFSTMSFAADRVVFEHKYSRCAGIITVAVNWASGNEKAVFEVKGVDDCIHNGWMTVYIKLPSGRVYEKTVSTQWLRINAKKATLETAYDVLGVNACIKDRANRTTCKLLWR